MKDELKEFKLTMTGHAIECRLCAENPCNDLLPARCSPLCDLAVVLKGYGRCIECIVHCELP